MRTLFEDNTIEESPPQIQSASVPTAIPQNQSGQKVTAVKKSHDVWQCIPHFGTIVNV